MTNAAKAAASEDERLAPTSRKRRPLRREEIVTAATRLFAERGYDGASMGDLAELVGLRKASLFHHFASKEALYGAVLETLVAGVKDAVATAASSEGSFAERLDLLTDAMTATLGAAPYAARLLVREGMDAGPVFRERLAPILDSVLAAAVAFGRAGQEAGAFRPDLDVEHLIVSAIGIHFMPFAIGDMIERFTGASPFASTYIEHRKSAVRQQVRNLVLVEPPRP